MLENFLRPKLDYLSDEHGADNVWFRQDGATAHTSRHSLRILREMFPGHVVSLCADIRWSPCSPYLAPYINITVTLLDITHRPVFH
jgi:hypothetical protein